eukprot:CAMPEP_0177737230 /NCGR_PEP_ID=MMETSP0484_2-20121128/25774_1 /TAXON_ID=354590 /ORGANISM="Rhodomonas lens, Strain RHODO" /LENGTH=153 /DNA_ID=CAMNT_0019250997 /DNA_START=214 /DNA_END=673 /DNA_ORIENTATION=+
MMGNSAQVCRAHTNLGCSLVWGPVIAVGFGLMLANMYMTAPTITSDFSSSSFDFEGGDENAVVCHGKGHFTAVMSEENAKHVFGTMKLELGHALPHRVSFPVPKVSAEETPFWFQERHKLPQRKDAISFAAIAVQAKDGTSLGRILPPDHPTA